MTPLTRTTHKKKAGALALAFFCALGKTKSKEIKRKPPIF